MKKTGVYTITNLINGKMIIGSGDLVKRKSWHFSKLRQNKHPNPLLQRACNKYGIENLVWDIIEYCEHSKCIENETFWVRFLQTKNRDIGYNILDPTDTRLGLKHTEETKEKIRKGGLGRINSEENRKGISERMKGNKFNLGRKQSEKEIQAKKDAYTPERRELLRNYRLGKKYSKETCEKISKALTGRKLSQEVKDKISIAGKGRKHTEEARKKISEGNKGKIIPEEIREKIRNSNIGRKMTDEQKLKMSESAKKRWAKRKLANLSNNSLPL